MEVMQQSFKQLWKFAQQKMKSFRRNDGGGLGDLPGFRNSGNGISMNVVNKSVLLSLGWLVLSLFVVIYGFRDCSYNSYSYRFECKSNVCTYTAKTNEGTVVKTIGRSDLQRVDTVRLNKEGAIQDYGEGNRRTSTKLGYSVQITYLGKQEEGATTKHVEKLLMVPKDMGRRSSRTASSKLFTYMDKTKDKIDVKHSNSVTLFGVLCIVLGFLSSLLSCVLGQWSDPEPRRVKKSS